MKSQFLTKIVVLLIIGIFTASASAGQPDMTIEKTAYFSYTWPRPWVTSLSPGDVFSYHLFVWNHSIYPAHDVRIRDGLPDGLSLQSWRVISRTSTMYDVLYIGDGVWVPVDVGGGTGRFSSFEQLELEITVQLDAQYSGDEIINTASVMTIDPESDLSNNESILALPVIRAPVACIVEGDRVVEADANCEARVVLDGSCSSDADSTEGTNDDINDFDWYDVIDVCETNSDIYLGSGEVIECNLGLGEHLIILEVTDKAGEFDSNEVVITVEDVRPPEFSLAVEPNVLWPPKRKMIAVTPSWEVSDNCDEEVEVSLVDISMSTAGDINDYAQIGDDGSIYLRARKSRVAGGRIYTLTYEAVDDSGNVAGASATVTVPNRRGRRRGGRTSNIERPMSNVEGR
ncbi:MAG: hypothetical protein ACYTE5_00485 [Planctomycetota bacterium]|jgi:uncharacterized repeat protein (TIGR01451 family)